MSEIVEKWRKLSKPDKILVSATAAAGATAFTLVGFAGHAAAAPEPRETMHCHSVTNLAESNIPAEDIDEAAIQNGLGLRASQLHKVKKYGATCFVPPEDELRFGIGISYPADAFEYSLGLLFKECIIYGAPTQVIPTVEDETRPAVVACIGPIAVEQV
jgi:hypothetical protein